MKKILALVLALTLALGTFSFAAAAPSDVVGTDYEDAVGKLTYLGIIAGFPDGTYKPAEPVTRAQFAKIIVTALGVGEAAQYAAGTTKFSDVPADHWASGYINVAVDLGIINGYPDGTFAPENQVTFAEAIKMIVAALGYTPRAEAMGGYPGGYLAIAAEKEITEDITVVGTLAANRGDIALMIDNALDVPMMVQKTWGQYPEYEEDEDQNLLKKLGVDEVEGRVVAIPRVDSKLDDNEIRIDGKDGDTFEVIAGVDFEIAFGQEVTAYVKKDKVLGLTIESDYFIDAIDDVTKNELTLVQEDEDYDIAKDALVFINGKKADADDLGTLYDYAKVVLNDDDDVAFIDAYEWDDFIVVEEVEDEVVFGYDEELDIDDYTIVKDGKAIDLEDLVEGDILFFKNSAEFAEVYNVSVTGEVEKVYEDSFKVAGKEFDYVYADGELRGKVQYLDVDELADFVEDVAESTMDDGGEVEVFMNRIGNAVFVVGDTGEGVTSEFYAYVVWESSTETDRRGDPYYELDVISETGEELSYDLYEADVDLKGNFTIGTVPPADYATFKAAWDAEVAKDVVLEIEVDEDGEVETITVLDRATNVVAADEFEVDDTYVKGFRVQSSAVVFDVEEYLLPGGTDDEDDIEVSTLADLGYDEIDVADIYVNNSGKVIVIVVQDGNRSTDTTDFFALATSKARKVSGEDTYRIDLIIDGVEDTYYTEEDAGTANAAGVLKGDFLDVAIDDNTKEIITITVYNSGAPGGRYVDGIVKDVAVGNATIDVDEDGDGTADNTYRLADAVVVDDDYDKMNLRDVEEGDGVKLFLVSTGSKYAAFAVVTEASSVAQDDVESQGTIAVTSYTHDTTSKVIRVKIGSTTKSYNTHAGTVLIDKNGDVAPTDGSVVLAVGDKVNLTLIEGTNDVDIIEAVELDLP